MTNRVHKSSHRRAGPMGVRSWLSIRVELVEGRGERCWPRPGRLFAAAASHSYAQLATAIDGAFARWDRSHLHEFELADGARIGTPDPAPDTSADDVRDDTRDHLSTPRTHQQFSYGSDLGYDCTHV